MDMKNFSYLKPMNKPPRQRATFLAFSPPQIGEEEVTEVINVLRSGWITTGPQVKLFEEKFAEFVGAPAALAVSSGTDAMLIALSALGIKPGDEIITTTMTFCSTVHVIEHAGGKPVLIDIEPDTMNIDPCLVEKAVTKHTRAIIPVHLYGHPCEMDQIREIADKHGLFILEDAAHALPASYKNQTIGSQDNLAAFSFYATKNITTAEGGMLTGNSEIVEQARPWSLHGMSQDAYKRHSREGSWHYQVVLPGYKCNMTDIQAAIGLHQLRKLPQFQQRRLEIVRRYNEAFSEYEELQIPVERPGVVSAWHLYTLRLNLNMLKIDRNQFIEQLKDLNIGSSVHFIPVHLHAYYQKKYGFHREDFPIAFENYKRLVTLPLHPGMKDADVEDVIAAVTYLIRKHRR